MEWFTLGIVALVVWVVFLALRGIFRALTGMAPTANDAESVASDEVDGMNEGDYHSGPAGYSPATAYPETQYGSGFDEEAEWNEEQ